MIHASLIVSLVYCLTSVERSYLPSIVGEPSGLVLTFSQIRVRAFVLFFYVVLFCFVLLLFSFVCCCLFVLWGGWGSSDLSFTGQYTWPFQLYGHYFVFLVGMHYYCFIRVGYVLVCLTDRTLHASPCPGAVQVSLFEPLCSEWRP